MKQILGTSFLHKLTRRCMCKTDAPADNIKKNNLEEMSKNLKNYLNESPLKNYDKKNEWATTSYPVGSQVEADKKDDSPRIDPETTSIIMFPGQGNQYVGMGKKLMMHSAVEDMFDAASSILHYDLKKLCLNGPLAKLNQTEYCQPATLVCSLAAIEELKVKYPSAINNCIATCGFSLGEITALVFAGSISFEQGVHITRIRAKAMQECSRKVQSGMLTVVYGSDSNLKEAMKAAKKECLSKGIENPVCDVANYLFPNCKVIAGHDVALNYIENNKSEYKLRMLARLPVSGAFHTPLMEEASIPFQEALRHIHIKEPLVPVLSNVSAFPYKGREDIKKLLPQQIYKPVKWEQILHYVYSRTPGSGFPHTYECGPGNSLSVTLKRVNSRAFDNCHKIEI